MLVTSSKLKDCVPEGLHSFFPKGKDNLMRLEHENDEDFGEIKGKLDQKMPGNELLESINEDEDEF